MIKKYKQYNESIRSLLVGPTEDEIFNHLSKLPINDLFFSSCKLGIFKGVKLALDRGVNIHLVDDHALRKTSSNGNTDIVKLLLDNGADIHVNKNEPLKNAAFHNHIDIVKLLIKKDYNVDDYKIPLIYAIIRNNIDMVKLFLDKGVDVYFEDEEPLKLASEKGYTNIVKLLKKYMENDKEI